MTRKVVRIAALAALTALLGAACSSSDDDDTTKPATTDAGADTTVKAADGEVPVLEVDRTSRFSKLDTFCEPATDEPEEAPEATDDGITATSVSIAHIRVTLEDLEGLGFAIPIGDTADQGEKFVGLINDRCGGIHGRKLDLHLVEAPPLAPAGQDPAAVAQAACIEATEDDHAVIAYSGSGWGGQGGAACVTGAHDTVYITTYNISEEDLAGADNRLYSHALGSAEGLEGLVRTVVEKGMLDGKTVGVVMQDAPGDPEIVTAGVLDTLEELGVEVKRVDTLGCEGGNQCLTGIAESVSGMIADGIDAMFPMLNLLSLPGYMQELVTQGVQPGDIQFFQGGYNAQSGDLVSSKIIEFGSEDAGRLYNGTVIVASAATGAFRLPGYEPDPFAAMCNREYQEAGGDTYSPTDPETNSAYGATAGSCLFIRNIARALEAAGPNPTRKDVAAAVEGLGAIDGGTGDIPLSWGPGKYTAPNELSQMTWHFPCDPDKIPFGPGMCILPEGDPFPIPEGD